VRVVIELLAVEVASGAARTHAGAGSRKNARPRRHIPGRRPDASPHM
jgi:hypothetical protein